RDHLGGTAERRCRSPAGPQHLARRVRRGMNRSALVEALDENMVVHASWLHHRLPGMRVQDDGRLLLADSGLASDTFNIACRARLGADVRERVAGAIRWFAGRKRLYSWWVSSADQPPDLGAILADHGLGAAETETAMAADLDGLLPASVDGFEVRRAGTPDVLREFARINAANWSPPDADVIRFYEAAAPVLLQGAAPLRYYVGYLDGVAVAAAEVTIAADVAGVYNVSTLEQRRRRGLASTLLRHALLDVRRQGIQRAVLQAAPGATGVYAQLGFHPTGQITEYKPS